MFLLLEIKDSDVVIPEFLGRLGLLTSRVLCPAAKVYRYCRALLCQRNVTVDSGLCSGVWGSLLNTPGPRLWSALSFDLLPKSSFYLAGVL